MPVLDDEKHYWVGDDEVEKLLRARRGLARRHPERELIARRYLAHQAQPDREALRAALAEDDAPIPTAARPTRDAEEAPSRTRISLHDAARSARSSPRCRRRRAPRARPGLRRGRGCCAPARRPRRSTEIVGVDVSRRALEIAARRLRLERLHERQRERVELLQGSLTYRDDRLGRLRRGRAGGGHRAPRPAAPAGVRARVFELARPATVVVTTPNAEYNVALRDPARRRAPPPRPPLRVDARRVRAPGPRGVAERLGYRVRYLPIGPDDPEVGAADPDGGVQPDERSTIPELSPGRARRPVRVGQVARSPARTSCRPRSCRRTSAAAWSPTTRTTSPRPRRRLRRSSTSSPASGSRAGRLTVVDATNVQPEARKPLVALAPRAPRAAGRDRARHARSGSARSATAAGPTATSARTSCATSARSSRRSLQGPAARGLPPRLRPAHARGGRRRRRSSASRCGTTAATTTGRSTSSATSTAASTSWTALLRELGYEVDARRRRRRRPHRTGRTAVFVGDLVDRGPRHARRAAAGHGMVEAGTALASPATTSNKLLRDAQRPQRADHARPGRDARAARRASRREFRDAGRATSSTGSISHYVLDDGRLVVAHAGLKEGCRAAAPGGSASSRCTARRPARPTSSACRCATTGPRDYRGKATVVYGHTPVPEPEWLNNTINIDTGCVFGGRLTALRYPSGSSSSVPAQRTYYEPASPFLPRGRRRRAVGEPRPTTCSTSTTCSASASSRRAWPARSRSARRTPPPRSR